MTPMIATAYFATECFAFLGLSESERFFLHLPDFVLSLSLDHFSFLTLGVGKNSPSVQQSRILVFTNIFLRTSHTTLHYKADLYDQAANLN